MTPVLQTRGICLITYGEKANKAGQTCQTSIAATCSYPVAVQTLRQKTQEGFSDSQLSRLAKVTLYDWSPFVSTCYLDADTIVRGSLDPGFEAIESGWDIALVPSPQQGSHLLWHVSEEDREQTFVQWGYRALLQLQCGVIWFARSERVKSFFRSWQQEWLLFKGQDQGAFLRALHKVPLKLWLLGSPFNGGAVVEHHWGACR